MASIKKRESGSFSVIYGSKDKDGKYKQKWETFKTRKEAERRMNELNNKSEIETRVFSKCATVEEIMAEYIEIYGTERWSISTYASNIALINNYILPQIGEVKLIDINTMFIERFYKKLLETKAVANPLTGKSQKEYVSANTVREIHKILNTCFRQAVKWEIIDRNPCEYANVPKHKSKSRDIWTSETLMYAIDVCKDERLKLAMNLSFACSLRIGEILGLKWDCVDITEEAIRTNNAYVYIDKELVRLNKAAIEKLNKKDILFTFPSSRKACTTLRGLKTPKTESSVRRVFLPRTVAIMLTEWKKKQDEIIEVLGDEYEKYNLVIAGYKGTPTENSTITESFKKLISEYNLPPVVFHSLRHTSVTYKLKLNSGDIKSVQGDSGHSQIDMITDVYSHIIDDDRRKNAEKFEEAFYKDKNANPDMNKNDVENVMKLPEGLDSETLLKVLSDPEMAKIIKEAAKKIKEK